MGYEMDDNKVLANVMIDISKKEGRYIVGSDDLKNYSQILMYTFAKDKVYLELSLACCKGYISNLSDVDTRYLMPIRESGQLESYCNQYASYYMLVPWVTRDDLLEIYRSCYPLDAMFWKVGEDIINSIPSISLESRQSMDEAYQFALTQFEKTTKESLYGVEEQGKIYCRRLEIIREKMIPNSGK